MSTQVTIPTLLTERLRLDAPREADFEGYAEIVCGPRGVGIGGPLTREGAWLDFSQMVAGWVLRGYGAWSVRWREEPEGYLGTALVHHEWGDPEPELGCLLLAEAEGLGVAQEVGRALLAWAFEHTSLETLVSYVDPTNARAIAAAERLGGVREAGPAGVLTLRYRR